MIRCTLIIFLFTSISSICSSQNATDHPEELGTISWVRNYEEAQKLSQAEGKPIFILFQEVPGCATCRNYGKKVLSHPMIDEAITHEFIPLAIYNNVGGHDREVLKMYDEPTWNNPVIRIVHTNGKDVISRLSGNYSVGGLATHMSLALKSLYKPVPEYLNLLAEERLIGKEETAFYKMYCFWTGEAHFGGMDGVVATEPGWMGGAEVVKVTYDRKEIKKSELDKFGRSASCKPVNQGKDYRPDKDIQYYLKKSRYRFLPLSKIQRTRMNAALGDKRDASIYLSPSQKKWLKEKKSSVVLYELPLEEAWTKIQGSSNQ